VSAVVVWGDEPRSIPDAERDRREEPETVQRDRREERRPVQLVVVDYGVGNLHSLVKALELCSSRDTRGMRPIEVEGTGPLSTERRIAVSIESDPRAILSADAVVLPGVGAFAPAAATLAPFANELRARLASGIPCLAICLGMQLLFEGSDEGAGAGLGSMRGRVRRIRANRVPHMGWNMVQVTQPSAPGGWEARIRENESEARASRADALFREREALHAYYANSYVAEPLDAGDVVAWSEHEGDRFPAAVRRGRTWGVQFHPEKSGQDGLRIIRNFLAEVAS
jgi:imidazole glycerol-phosphate synthase subunit HisH